MNSKKEIINALVSFHETSEQHNKLSDQKERIITEQLASNSWRAKFTDIGYSQTEFVSLSFFDFYETWNYCQRNKKSQYKTSKEDLSWSGVSTKQYVERLKRGYHEKYRESKDKTSLTRMLLKEIKMPQKRYRVDKGKMIIPKVTQNIPLCRKSITPVKEKELTVFISLSASAYWEAEDYEKVAKKMLAVKEIVEKSSIKVTFRAFFSSNQYLNEGCCSLLRHSNQMTIIRMPDRITEKEMRHLISVETFRKLYFSILELNPNLTSDYGNPKSELIDKYLKENFENVSIWELNKIKVSTQEEIIKELLSKLK